MKPLQMNKTGEWTFTSIKKYADPFNEVEPTVCFHMESLDCRRLTAHYYVEAGLMRESRT